MNSCIAPQFSEKAISLRESWCYCRDSFAGDFEALLQAGAFQESGPGEKIWETRSKYVLKIALEKGGPVVYKGYRRISKPLSYLLRPSPCGLEAGNFQRIADLGIPVPELLAVGEERSRFRLSNAFIITRFAQGFRDGRAFLPGGEMAEEDGLKEEFLRRHLALLGICHDGGIFHRGFTPANIMWKKRSAPDKEGNWLDLLWIDLASCRKVPFFILNRCCGKDLRLCLKPFGFSREKLAYFIDLYGSFRQKKAPSLKAVKAHFD